MAKSPSFLFSFNIGGGFLQYATHTIHIPSEQIDYAALQSSGIDLKHLTVVFPRGESAADRHYEVKSGRNNRRGPYLQMRMQGENRAIPAYLKLGDKLLVIICRYGPRAFVFLEFRQ